MSNSILLLAGEKSGEEHALTFVNELIASSKKPIKLFGVGGDDLQAKDMDLLYHVKDFSFMGFSGILKLYPFYRKAFNHIVDEVVKRGCRNAILVDFQTFNLKLASELHGRGVRVFYYVAPQAWSWKAWRAKTLAKVTFALFTIIKFEKKWFEVRGVKNVISVSHPVYRKYKDMVNFDTSGRNEILFLPGSRNSEVSALMPDFADIARTLKTLGYKTALVKTQTVESKYYEMYQENFDCIYNSENLDEALKNAYFSFAASGTVTLTLALFKVPTIVCYRGTLFNEFIFRHFIRYKGMISLANIVHEKYIFPEYIQDEIQKNTLLNKFQEMTEMARYQSILDELTRTKDLLAGEDLDVGKYIADNLKEV